MLSSINEILATCETEKSLIPPTELYNEGWMLRLVLNWFYTNNNISHKLSFKSSGSSWFSEALLPSPFLARYRGDKLAESHTNADGVMGDIQIGHKGKRDIKLRSNAAQFVVLEAKIYSKLSSGVSNASYYDQAARNVACMVEVISRSALDINDFHDLAFYVLAPKEQIDIKPSFRNYTAKESIKEKVDRRIKAYDKKDRLIKEEWYKNWFLPVLELIKIECLTWEHLIDFIGDRDTKYTAELEEFYNKCLEYNG